MHVLKLSDPCPSVDKKRRGNTGIDLHYMATPSKRNAVLGVMKFTISVDPSVIILNSQFVLCIPGSREEG